MQHIILNIGMAVHTHNGVPRVIELIVIVVIINVTSTATN